MSKKKSDDFNSSPFKKLKGLSLQNKPEIKTKVIPLPVSNAIREFDFSSEMKSLGVKVLDRDEELRADPPSKENLFSTPPAVTEPLNDEEIFLQALQGIEVVFTDELPDLEIPCASPRRMKLVEQGRLLPTDRLDLHGFTRSEARRRTINFIENAVHYRHPLVIIVTGWGKHGSGDAVLKDEIMRFLRTEGASLVSEWSLAPPKLGGDGALLIFPRIKRKA